MNILPQLRRSTRRLRRAFDFAIVVVSRRLLLHRQYYSVQPVFTNQLARAYVSRGHYESDIDRVYRTVLQQRSGAFIDVGANVGQTLLKLLAIDPSRQYLGFEPQVLPCACIAEFINQNKLTHCNIFSLGLSSTAGYVKLGTRESSDVAASFVSDFRPEGFYSRYQLIPVAAGDHILSELGILETALIKIDVEGAELEVLLGLQTALANQQPVIVFEVLPDYLLATRQKLNPDICKTRAHRYKRIGELLGGMGYVLLRQESGAELVDIQEIRSDPRHVQNLIAVHRSQLSTFRNAYDVL